MESLSFENIATGRPLCFKVGPRKREFFMHSALVSSLSPPLNQIANGPWAESTDAVVEWEKVEEATFVHFCQFAYTGTYRVENTPSAKVAGETALVTPSENAASMEPIPPILFSDSQPRMSFGDDDWDSSTWPMSKKDKKKKKKSSSFFGSDGVIKEEETFPEQFTSVFQQILADKCPTDSVSGKPPEAAPSDVTRCYSYSDIFLAHARLFVFADCYQIDSLADQALRNLHQALTTNKVQHSDVVDVTEFCVSTEIPQTLREVMLAYITSKASSAWGIERFRKLVLQDNDMMAELLDLIMKATMVEQPTVPGPF